MRFALDFYHLRPAARLGSSIQTARCLVDGRAGSRVVAGQDSAAVQVLRTIKGTRSHSGGPLRERPGAMREVRRRSLNSVASNQSNDTKAHPLVVD
jgi:hypothetical protein